MDRLVDYIDPLVDFSIDATDPLLDLWILFELPVVLLALAAFALKCSGSEAALVIYLLQSCLFLAVVISIAVAGIAGIMR